MITGFSQPPSFASEKSTSDEDGLMAMPSSPRPMIWVQAGTASLPVFTEILKSLERTLVGVPVMALLPSGFSRGVRSAP